MTNVIDNVTDDYKITHTIDALDKTIPVAWECIFFIEHCNGVEACSVFIIEDESFV